MALGRWMVLHAAMQLLRNVTGPSDGRGRPCFGDGGKVPGEVAVRVRPVREGVLRGRTGALLSACRTVQECTWRGSPWPHWRTGCSYVLLSMDGEREVQKRRVSALTLGRRPCRRRVGARSKGPQ